MSVTYKIQPEKLTYFFPFGIIWQDLGWDLKLLMHSFYEAIHDFCIQFLSKVIEIIVLRYCMLGTYDQCRFFYWLIFFYFAWLYCTILRFCRVKEHFKCYLLSYQALIYSTVWPTYEFLMEMLDWNKLLWVEFAKIRLKPIILGILRPITVICGANERSNQTSSTLKFSI